MANFENFAQVFEPGKSYSRKDVVANIKLQKPGLSESAYNWAVGAMVRDGRLQRTGYNSYNVAKDTQVSEYQPFYSQTASNLINCISKKYPCVKFTVFEAVLLNRFLNHLIAQNTIFVQVEKENSIYVFRFLQEKGVKNLLYKPNKGDFSLYWTKDCVIVTDMISESPLRLHEPHTLILEKLLVDIYSDELISSLYNNSEFPDIVKQAESQYALDKTKLLRYARRRNKEQELKKLLCEEA